jgi:hypothetical protein
MTSARMHHRGARLSLHPSVLSALLYQWVVSELGAALVQWRTTPAQLDKRHTSIALADTCIAPVAL